MKTIYIKVTYYKTEADAADQVNLQTFFTTARLNPGEDGADVADLVATEHADTHGYSPENQEWEWSVNPLS